jgi:quinohemoprotein ethanol dehydrogenase
MRIMSKGFVKAGLAVGVAMLALAGIGRSASPPAAGVVDGRDWYSFGGTDSADHYSSLRQISASNVSKLGLVWSYDIDTFDGYTEPLEVNGTVYFAVGHSVIHALDARTGKLLWQYDPQVAEQPAAETRLRAGWGIRGIAYRDGKVFTGTRDGRLIAVDARTGKLLWSVDTLDEEPHGYITGPPFVAGDNVVIGFGGSDYDTNRGYVTAYNIKTGKKAWRFFVVPGAPAKGFENKAMEMAAKTWTGEWWKYGGGGSVFHAMAYDAKFNRIYIGTGNGYPWNQKIRSPGGGDNLFLASIVALDAKTGDYVWHYQTNPGVTWDFNDAMDIQLADLTINGRQRPVLVHAPKNGFYYVIDRETGKLLSAEKFATVNWAVKIDMATGRPIENPESHYPDGKRFLLYPFPNGAHGVQAMSTSLQTKLTYIPVMEGARWHVDPPSIADWKVRPGMMINTGLGAVIDKPSPPAKSSLVAWDPVAQKPAWSIPQPGVFNGGILSTGGNLIFQGQNTGRLVAYSADKGVELWNFDAQNGMLGAPISYSVGGRQYITIIASFRSSYRATPNWDYRQQKRRVLTFALGGTKTLPPYTPTEEPIQDDPNFVIDPAKVAIGTGVYNTSCVVCHGVGAAAGGAAPDLRQSAVPLDADAFRSVVHDGALMARGMGKFANLSDQELEGLRHMIRQRARDALQKK